MSEAKASAGFPPAHHLVRDLRVVVEGEVVNAREGEVPGEAASGGGRAGAAEQAVIRLPIVPELFDASGRPRVGVVAVIADMVAGQTAIRAVGPSWIATGNLGLAVDTLPCSGTLEGRPQVLRQGATTIVIEVALAHRESGRAVGIATLGFSILPRRSEMQAALLEARASAAGTVYAPVGRGLAKPLLEAMGVAFDPTDPAVAEVPLDPYLLNTLGALQGGVVAILMEATAERFARVTLAAPVRVRGIELQYLKLGRKGPIAARARALARTPWGLIARVELFDRGEADARLTLATVWIERVGAAPT